MKKFLIVLLALSGAMTAWADEFPYLTFETADGTLSSVAVENLTITIEDGQLVATNADKTKTFNLSDLNKMYFSTSDTATAAALIATDQPVELFTVEGIALGRFATLDAARRQLRRGVYVVKSDNGTNLKIAVK